MKHLRLIIVPLVLVALAIFYFPWSREWDSAQISILALSLSLITFLYQIYISWWTRASMLEILPEVVLSRYLPDVKQLQEITGFSFSQRSQVPDLADSKSVLKINVINLGDAKVGFNSCTFAIVYPTRAYIMPLPKYEKYGMSWLMNPTTGTPIERLQSISVYFPLEYINEELGKMGSPNTVLFYLFIYDHSNQIWRSRLMKYRLGNWETWTIKRNLNLIQLVDKYTWMFLCWIRTGIYKTRARFSK